MVDSLPQAITPLASPPIEISDGICRSFEAIEIHGGFDSFCEEYNVFDGLSLGFTRSAKPTDDDYTAMKTVLYIAFALRELATTKEKPTKELPLGCELVETPIQPIGKDLETLMAYNINLKFTIPGRFYASYLARHLADGSVSKLTPFEHIPSKWTLSNGQRFMSIENGMATFTISDTNRLIAESGTPDITLLAKLTLDYLMNLHLSDVQTISRDGGIPRQETKSGISALWLAYGNRFAHVRVTTCKACGKPIIVTGERGKPRKYCDGTCRQWANRNPPDENGKRKMRIR